MRLIGLFGGLIFLGLIACWGPTAAAEPLPEGSTYNILVLAADTYVAAAEVSTSIVMAQFCNCDVTHICTNKPEGFECSSPPTCCHCSGSPGARVCILSQ